MLLLPLLITVIVIARVALMKKPTPAVRATIAGAAARAKHAIGIFHQYTLVYYVRFIDRDTGICYIQILTECYLNAVSPMAGRCFDSSCCRAS